MEVRVSREKESNTDRVRDINKDILLIYRGIGRESEIWIDTKTQTVRYTIQKDRQTEAYREYDRVLYLSCG